MLDNRIIEEGQEGPRGAYGSAVVAALEGAWKQAQEFHPDLPDVVMITGTGVTMGGLKWGHFGQDFWTSGARMVTNVGHGPMGQVEGRIPTATSERRVAELMVTGECLDQGGRYALETMLHEGAHALAKVRGIQETSRQRRYHNKRFVALAEELGLEGPEVAHPTIGWSDTRILTSTLKRYSGVLGALEAAIRDAHIETGLTDKGRGLTGGHGGGGRVKGAPIGTGQKGGTVATTTRGGTTSRRVKISCGCETPRNLWGSRSVIEAAAITCEECGEAFEER